MVVDLVALVEEHKEHFTEEAADAAIAMVCAQHKLRTLPHATRNTRPAHS